MENYSVTQAFAFHHRNVMDSFFFIFCFFYFILSRFNADVPHGAFVLNLSSKLISWERPFLNGERLAVSQWRVVQSGTVASHADRHGVMRPLHNQMGKCYGEMLKQIILFKKKNWGTCSSQENKYLGSFERLC